jgi:PBP1b-binding outer membrane lipoprotein LpoB
MKTKIVLAAVLLAVVISSCSRAVTPGEAASGKYKKCRPVR